MRYPKSHMSNTTLNPTTQMKPTEPLRIKFTKHAVTAVTLPPGKDDQIAWNVNLPTCGVRMRRGQKGITKTYVVQPTGKPKIVIGDVRKYTPDAAEKIAKQLLAKIALGDDPRAEKKKAKQAALTFGNTADRYRAARNWARRTAEQGELYLGKRAASLRSRPLAAIQRADAAAWLQELSQQRGRMAAKAARMYASAMYNWAAREGLCDVNPFANTNNPGLGSKPRERTLDDGELKNIFAARLEDDFSIIVGVLAFTGLRRDEVGGLRWSEVNLDAGVLNVPGNRTKNKRALTLMLPEPVLDILRAIPRRDGPCVFGDPQAGFQSWSHHKKLLDARLAAAGVRLPPWTLHDLRRTFRSGLGRLGVPPHIAELAIGHVRKGLEATYDRYHYGSEIAEAHRRWAGDLSAVLSGAKGKVVLLRTA
jgi:integrase